MRRTLECGVKLLSIIYGTGFGLSYGMPIFHTVFLFARVCTISIRLVVPPELILPPSRQTPGLPPLPPYPLVLPSYPPWADFRVYPLPPYPPIPLSPPLGSGHLTEFVSG